MSVLASQIETVRQVESRRVVGRVDALRGMTALVEDLPLPVGSLVRIGRAGPSGASIVGEIVGFERSRAIVMALGTFAGVGPGDPVAGIRSARSIDLSEGLLGRCIDGLGRPLDGRPLPAGAVSRPLDPSPPEALSRRSIDSQLLTGVRAIDLMLPLGRGQRIGVFAGPGVGKSTLLGDIARQTSADVSVIALIGERGREVGDFISKTLGPDGLARSVLVISTSDESPLLRIRAALAACTVSEFFKERGANVLLMMDSITRYAHALRQVGLSVGEAPATRGYTPSVFGALARLLERAGSWTDDRDSAGSITGIYSVLVEGDDMTEPVTDAARGILDGHIALSRELAQRGHFPAIDLLDSVSRVADDVSEGTHVAARRQVVRSMAAYRDIEELVQVGAYAPGADPVADVALEYRDAIGTLVRQDSGDREAFDASRARLIKIAMEIGAQLQARSRVVS